MKKILTYFFVTLGVIFFLLLIGLAYFWFADPLNIRPMISSFTGGTTVSQSQESSSEAGVTTTGDKHPALSEEHEQALEKIGIDPETLPNTITPEMKACFVAKLGEARVQEIVEGATPTPVEVFQTRECY